MQDAQRPMLRIAAYDTYCTNDLQPILRAFTDAHPEATPQVFSRDSRDVAAGILERRFDVGVISGRMSEMDSVYQEVIRNDQIIIVASATCIRKYSKMQLLCDMPVIRYLANNAYAEQLDTCIRQSAILSERSIDFSGLDSVKSAVLHHIGIAALSTDLIRKELTDGELVPLDAKAPLMNAATTVVFLKEKAKDKLVSSFVQLARDGMTV